MIRFLLLLLAAFGLIGCVPAYAGLAVTSAASPHTHTDANTGGATLTSPTIATPTLTSPTIDAPSVTGAATFAGAVASTLPCLTNYVRVTPNLCMKNATLAYTALTRDACTTLSLTGVKAILFDFQLLAVSANSVLMRESYIEVWNGAACDLKLIDRYAVGVYEFTALAAGTSIGLSAFQALLEANAAGEVFVRFIDDAGNQGTAAYWAAGYVD